MPHLILHFMAHLLPHPMPCAEPDPPAATDGEDCRELELLGLMTDPTGRAHDDAPSGELDLQGLVCAVGQTSSPDHDLNRLSLLVLD